MQSGLGQNGVGPGSLVCVGVSVGAMVARAGALVATGSDVTTGAQALRIQAANKKKRKNL
jgi:hypothetical protein